VLWDAFLPLRLQETLCIEDENIGVGVNAENPVLFENPEELGEYESGLPSEGIPVLRTRVEEALFLVVLRESDEFGANDEESLVFHVDELQNPF